MCNTKAEREYKWAVGTKTMCFRKKVAYGKNYYYPANGFAEDARKIFSYRSSVKAFTAEQVSFFKFLGAKIVLVADDTDGLSS